MISAVGCSLKTLCRKLPTLHRPQYPVDPRVQELKTLKRGAYLSGGAAVTAMGGFPMLFADKPWLAAFSCLPVILYSLDSFYNYRVYKNKSAEINNAAGN